MSEPLSEYEELMAACCKGAHKPHQVKFYIPDTFARWKYTLAGKTLYGVGLADFYQMCAAHVLQCHPDLEEVRAKIRQAEQKLARKRPAVAERYLKPERVQKLCREVPA